MPAFDVSHHYQGRISRVSIIMMDHTSQEAENMFF